MDDHLGFPQVGLGSDLLPIDEHPRLPGTPHNLPPRKARLLKSGGQLTSIFDQHHYARPTESAWALSNVTDTVVQQDATGFRNWMMLRNTDAVAIMFIVFGSQATPQAALALQPGDIVFFDTSVPQNEIHALSDVLNAVLALSVSEIVY